MGKCYFRTIGYRIHSKKIISEYVLFILANNEANIITMFH